MFSKLSEMAKTVDKDALMQKATDLKTELKDENSAASKQVEGLKDKLNDNNQKDLAEKVGQLQEKLREN